MSGVVRVLLFVPLVRIVLVVLIRCDSPVVTVVLILRSWLQGRLSPSLNGWIRRDFVSVTDRERFAARERGTEWFQF